MTTSNRAGWDTRSELAFVHWLRTKAVSDMPKTDLLKGYMLGMTRNDGVKRTQLNHINREKVLKYCREEIERENEK